MLALRVCRRGTRSWPRVERVCGQALFDFRNGALSDLTRGSALTRSLVFNMLKDSYHVYHYCISIDVMNFVVFFFTLGYIIFFFLIYIEIRFRFLFYLKTLNNNIIYYYFFRFGYVDMFSLYMTVGVSVLSYRKRLRLSKSVDIPTTHLLYN